MRRVGIAAHPGGNPADSSSEATLIQKLEWLRAQDTLEFFVTTNFCLSPEEMGACIRPLRDAGLDVYAGLPGPCSLNSLAKFATRCKLKKSEAYLAEHGPALFAQGLSGPDFARASAEEAGARRLHLYAFGGLKKALTWIADHTGPERALPAASA
jgi:5,10-methylenetetrahydrofolate reductase